MATQTINISLPEELVKKIDNVAKSEFASRSDFIRQALVGKLKATEARERAEDWLLLDSLAEEATSNAEQLGYVSDADFVRAVKEVRRTRTAQRKS